jgi:hypothetical protein
LHARASSISKRHARSGTTSTTAAHGKECCRSIVGGAVELHPGATSGTTHFFIDTRTLVLLTTFWRMHETEVSNRRLVRMSDSLVEEGSNTCWVCGAAFQQLAERCGDMFLANSRLGLHVKVKSILQMTLARKQMRTVASEFGYRGHHLVGKLDI